jgi:hypothetical protein
MAIILKPENVAQLVFFIRGEKVMLDADLAMLYGVEARALNQAVARNRKRFPADFMFQLSKKEYNSIRSQFVTTSGRAIVNSSQTVMSSRKHRGRAYHPYAFTEQGVAMLSSVLRSERAVENSTTQHLNFSTPSLDRAVRAREKTSWISPLISDLFANGRSRSPLLAPSSKLLASVRSPLLASVSFSWNFPTFLFLPDS